MKVKGATMELLSSTHPDGFEPSGPLSYAESPFWTILALSAGCVATLVIFIASEKRDGQGKSPALKVLLALVAMMVAACPVFVSTQAPPYGVSSEAARWAHDRYGVEMTPGDARSLFGAGGHNSEATLDDGTTVATRADGEGSVLVRSGSDELPVVGD